MEQNAHFMARNKTERLDELELQNLLQGGTSNDLKNSYRIPSPKGKITSQEPLETNPLSYVSLGEIQLLNYSGIQMIDTAIVIQPSFDHKLITNNYRRHGKLSIHK